MTSSVREVEGFDSIVKTSSAEKQLLQHFRRHVAHVRHYLPPHSLNILRYRLVSVTQNRFEKYKTLVIYLSFIFGHIFQCDDALFEIALVAVLTYTPRHLTRDKELVLLNFRS